MVANLYYNSLQVSKSLETNFASFESGKILKKLRQMELDQLIARQSKAMFIA